MMADVAGALGWAVLSFLWQGVAIGALCAVVLRLVPRSAPGARYAVAGGALALGFLVFCTTALWSTPGPAQSQPLDDLLVSAGALRGELVAALSLVPGAPLAEAPSPAWISAVAWLWALGALWMTLRLTLACGAAHRLKSRSRIKVDQHVQMLANRLCVDLGLRRRVRLFATELADSPLVVGWLRPVVLVPTATLLVLSKEQLRSVLAHELAHIRRLDPLFNALQAVVEVLLFFHPVTWWLSAVVRQEREHCCDLAAVRAAGGPLPLARALTRLESHRQSSSEVVLAARPKPGFLMTRIQRILDLNGTGSPRRVGLRPMTLLATVAVALGLGIASAAASPRPEPAAASVLSLEGRDAHGDYAIVEARILEAVEAGTLSAADAKTVLGALRKSMFAGEHARPERVRLLPPAVGSDQAVDLLLRRRHVDEVHEEIQRQRAELQEAQERGKLTREEAAEKRAVLEKRFSDFKQRLDPGRSRNPLLHSGVPLIGELFDQRSRAERRLEDAVEKHEVSQEEARGKLEALRRGVEAKRRASFEGRRDRNAELLRQLEDAVAAGRVNPEEAKGKFEALRREAEAKGQQRVQGRWRRDGQLERYRLELDLDGQRRAIDPRVDPERLLPPDRPGVRNRKVETDEAMRLQDRLRALEMELERVQEEANRASREMSRREQAGRGDAKGRRGDRKRSPSDGAKKADKEGKDPERRGQRVVEGRQDLDDSKTDSHVAKDKRKKGDRTDR